MIVEAVLAASRDAGVRVRIGRTPRRLGAAQPGGELLGIGPRAGVDDESWICLSARVRTGDDGDAAGDRLRAAIVRSLDCVAAVHADRSAMIESLRLTADEIDRPGGDVESARPAAVAGRRQLHRIGRVVRCAARRVPHGPGPSGRAPMTGGPMPRTGVPIPTRGHTWRAATSRRGYHGRTIRSSSADRNTAGSDR